MVGFRGESLRVLGLRVWFKGSGFRVLQFRDLGVRVLGLLGFRVGVDATVIPTSSDNTYGVSGSRGP